MQHPSDSKNTTLVEKRSVLIMLFGLPAKSQLRAWKGYPQKSISGILHISHPLWVEDGL
jgi:hypothetical protein